MAKIKIIRYPYREYSIGEIVDLGTEKNKSLVALGRAVWYDEGVFRLLKKKTQENKVEVKIEEASSEEVRSDNKPKIENKIRKSISENKTSSSSFWDKLK